MRSSRASVLAVPPARTVTPRGTMKQRITRLLAASQSQ
jgi:hypothetical protein